MALEAYCGRKTCPICHKEIHQKNGRGRTRTFCSSACKQSAYRDRLAACLHCGQPAVLYSNPWIGMECRCSRCGALMKYTRGMKQQGWAVVQKGRTIS